MDVLYDVGRLGLVLVGEELRFMLSPEDLVAFVEPLGYHVAAVARPDELKAQYNIGEREIYPGCFTACLVVSE